MIPLRVGIVGWGNIAMDRHAPVLQELEETTVAAVADSVPERREEARRKLSLSKGSVFESHVVMLSESQLDYVLISVPPAVRRPIIEDSLDAGVHVLSEKPLATRPADAKALIERNEQARLKFGIVHNYIYLPELSAIRGLIEEGAIGEVRHVGLTFMGVADNPGHKDYRPQWRHLPQEAGGGILMDMIHVFYVAEYLMRDRIKAVSAVVDSLSDPGDSVEDITLAHLYFGRGYASIALSWGLGPGGVEVTGSKGRLVAPYDVTANGPVAVCDELTVVTGEGETTLPLANSRRIHDTFVKVHQDFARAVTEDREPAAPAEEGLRALEAAMAAYTSAVLGHVVELPLRPEDPVFLRGTDGLRALDPWPGSPVPRAGILGFEPYKRSET